MRGSWGIAFGALLLGVVEALSIVSATAEAAPGAVPSATIVVDAATAEVLKSEQATALWRPASLTKLMTLYITFQELAAGHLKLDERLTVSGYAAAMPPSRLGLAKGEKITVEEAILATVTRSANDAVVVLAERIGGDETTFAQRMTATARAIGMTGSVFRNASGLPDPEQTTTAHDMAVLALSLIRDFPQFYRFFSARGVSHLGGYLPTINAILNLYPGADGLKTGFTCGSGYNLVASAERNGRRVIGVVLGGLTSDQRYRQMTDLLDAGFAVEPGEDPMTLDQMAKTAVGAPPTQLSAEDCTPGWSLQPDGEVAGRLPGWGIVFGGYPQAAATRALLSKSVKQIPPALRAGRPSIILRQYEGARSYRAVMVGLTATQARDACRALQGSGSYCLVLSPAVLNNPKAAWR
jgi:D-alanyl-D-alanine carboxypeptidase